MSVIATPLVKVLSEIVPIFATGSLIVIVKVSLSEPPELFAYNVYVTGVVWFTDGVPLITPPDIESPLGRAGSISQVATAPPVLLATIFVIAVSLVKVWSAIVPRIATGSLIVIVKVSLSDPPELLAYRV